MYLPINREWSRKVAMVLIAAGVILAPDILMPTFTDFINVGLAMMLADSFGMAYFEALMLTFSIAFAMILMGILIYPYNSKRLLLGKMKSGAGFLMSNPLLVIAAVAALLILYWYGSVFYETQYQAIKTYASALIGSS